ncbi:MAG: sigma-70 family RNA polymerase sigma factor [Proteobacteria bacterium]|nr:sigma-70 family RNA polymerase sigma factor [Pseudomonadota bacterium]
MTSTQLLTDRLQTSRSRLKSLAYGMLGSAADAEDALQDAWIRVRQFDPDQQEEIENAEGWLTTVVARICMDKLRARKARHEDAARPTVPDMLVDATDDSDPEKEVQLAEEVGLALQVVLETLPPPERVAFVLHDLFDRSYSEIAALLDCSLDAARQLASRGRRRTRSGRRGCNDCDPVAERQIVNAFFAASQSGDLAELLRILHPDVVFRADGGATRPAATAVIHGAREVANRAETFAVAGATLQPVQVNGSAGVIVQVGKRPVAIMAFSVFAGQISEIYCLLDTDRIPQLLQPT